VEEGVPVTVRVTLSSDRSLAYIYLCEIKSGGAVRTAVVKDGPFTIALDFDSEHHLLGIELLGAENALPPEFVTKVDEGYAKMRPAPRSTDAD
jgi:Protein of unknown function (DUF2283)